jgi:GH24 family phage-related lysozyme (muramidase)
MTNKDKFPKGVMPTMTMAKSQKKQKLRNAEYIGLQGLLDRLYAQSKENHKFTALMDMLFIGLIAVTMVGSFVIRRTARTAK